jgi:hypothetical protein
VVLLVARGFCTVRNDLLTDSGRIGLWHFSGYQHALALASGELSFMVACMHEDASRGTEVLHTATSAFSRASRPAGQAQQAGSATRALASS